MNKQKVTEEMINRIQIRCHALLEEKLFGNGDASSNSQSLDASFLLDQMVWQILIPIFVSVTGGVIVDQIKKKISSNVKDNEKNVREMVDQDIINISREQYDRCFQAIHEILIPYGYQDQDIQTIAHELIEETHAQILDQK